MNTKVETQTSGLDKVKWLIAIALAVAGLWGFYYFENNTLFNMTSEPLNDPVRWIGMLFMFGLAVVVAVSTASGKNFWEFLMSANMERKKVVWPSGPETRKTTWMVFVVVLLIGIFLAILDWIFSSMIAWLVG